MESPLLVQLAQMDNLVKTVEPPNRTQQKLDAYVLAQLVIQVQIVNMHLHVLQLPLVQMEEFQLVKTVNVLACALMDIKVLHVKLLSLALLAQMDSHVKTQQRQQEQL